jgi:hypothetical protein
MNEVHRLLLSPVEGPTMPRPAAKAEPVCTCRASARCLPCIERDGLTKAKAA